MYKKAIALFVATALFLLLPCSVYASAENEFPYIDQNIILETPAECQTYFDSSEINNIQYNYVLSVNENGTRFAQCTILMIIETNNGCYEASAQGKVTEYIDLDGISIWHGPLDGTIVINNNNVNLTLGFTKFDDADNIHASISIFDNDISDYPVLFSFGDIEIMDSIVQVLASEHTSSLDNPLVVPMGESTSTNAIVPTPGDTGGGLPDLGANGEWDALTRDFDYYGGTGSNYYALESRAYFNGGTDRVMITAISYCDKIADNWDNVLNQWAEVKEIDVNLEVLTDDPPRYAYIAAVQNNGFRNSDRLTPGQLLAPLFGDILSLFGIPSSTLTALISQKTGSVDYDHHGNTAYFNIEVSPLENLSFDVEPGLPFIFVLENGDSESYVGGTRLRCTTTVKYIIWGHSMETHHDTFYYLTSNTELEFEVTL